MRGEDYRGRGGEAGRRLWASFWGMKGIINVMEGRGGRGGRIHKLTPGKL